MISVSSAYRFNRQSNSSASVKWSCWSENVFSFEYVYCVYSRLWEGPNNFSGPTMMFSGIPQDTKSHSTISQAVFAHSIYGVPSKEQKVHRAFYDYKEYGIEKECPGIVGPKIFPACRRKSIPLQIHKPHSFITYATAHKRCHYYIYSTNNPIHSIEKQQKLYSTLFIE